jgi:hypothetical protein
MTDDDKVKSGYSTALQLISYEGQLIWRAFNSCITANSFLIAIGGLLVKESSSSAFLRLISFSIPILGWMLCFCWYMMLQRQFGYYGYWFAWARFFEKRFLAPIVRITLEGHERFSRGDAAVIDMDDSSYPRPTLSGLMRFITVRRMMSFVIVIFVILYGILFIWHLLRSLA